MAAMTGTETRPGPKVGSRTVDEQPRRRRSPGTASCTHASAAALVADGAGPLRPSGRSRS